MFQIQIVEDIKTHVLYSVIFFFENGSCYEIMSKNMVEPERPQKITWRMRFAPWIHKTTRAQTHAHAFARAHTHTHLRTRFPTRKNM
jgi:hypothetical protein